MNRFSWLILLILCIGSAHGQTALFGGAEVLPDGDGTPNALMLLDSEYKFTGFRSPATLTNIEVSSATAANPMVLTLASLRPVSIQIGSEVTLTGAMGSGCSGMNATHPVSAVGASTITITFNGAGCTYTAGSADLVTSWWLVMPETPQASTDNCLTLPSGYTLSFGGCVLLTGNQSISGNKTFSGNIYASGTPDIGQGAAPFDDVFATRVLGEQVKIVNPASSFGTSWTFDLADASTIRLRDNAAGVFMQGGTSGGGFVTWAAGLFPNANNTYPFGSTSLRWSKAWVVDLDISGTCTGCATGANTSLSNLSSVAFNAALVPDGNMTRDVGSSSSAIRDTFGDRGLFEEVKIANPGSSFATSWTFDLADASTIRLRDNASGVFMQGGTSGGGFVTWAGGLFPATTNTHDLGSTSLRWDDFWMDGDLGGNMTVTGSLKCGSGNCYMRDVGGDSSAVSCTGPTVDDGWYAITDDNYLVVCNGSGTRYRVALTSY